MREREIDGAMKTIDNNRSIPFPETQFSNVCLISFIAHRFHSRPVLSHPPLQKSMYIGHKGREGVIR